MKRRANSREARLKRGAENERESIENPGGEPKSGGTPKVRRSAENEEERQK